MTHTSRSTVLAGTILAMSLTARAQTPTPAGATPSRLDLVSQRMQEFVNAGEIAGAVTLVARADQTVHLDATGWADIAAKTPMQADTIFWIASMTKPITAAAVLMLQDEGKLAIDDPATKYLPELRGLKTADGASASVTLRHMLTHTSGLAENTPEELAAAGTLAELIPLFASRPVQFSPGSKWQYCQSGINSLGRIVELVSGKSLPEFLDERLFAPLGMKDTAFYLTAAQLPRLAKSYRHAGGRIEETPVFFLSGRSPTDRARYPAANGGLFSTAPDYSRFARMVLNGGVIEGRRYLTPDSVRLMTTLQTGDLETGFTGGNGWGLGWCVVREPQGVTAALSPGSFGHGGAYGTQAWLDPVKGLAYILMVQRADFPNSDASDVRRAFQDAAAAALARE